MLENYIINSGYILILLSLTVRDVLFLRIIMNVVTNNNFVEIFASKVEWFTTDMFI